jgi:alkylation response protein AidB-like acyl-CoA dehydrogenase
MSNLANPITLLKTEWVNTIRSEAANAEKQGKLTKKQLALINEQEWFRLLAPTAYGGKQLSLPDLMQIEEALACADGSFGWVVTLCAGAGWFGGFMNPELAKKVFGTEKICLSGSSEVKGTADVTATGYVVNGKWNYAAGSAEATAFTANCHVLKGGKPVNDANGKPKVLSFLFNKNEVILASDWNGIGLAATSANSFEVRDLAIGNDRAINSGEEALVNSALYHYPFKELAEATLAINLCGMAMHFMDLCGNIISEDAKVQKVAHINYQNLQETYNNLLSKLQTARQKLYYSVDMSWQACAANKDISQSVLYKVSAAVAVSAEVIRNCVSTLFPYCGYAAAEKDSELNRVWRDIHTAGQSTLLIGDGSY